MKRMIREYDIYEMNHSLYNEIDMAASFPSYEKTPISSVTTTGTPEGDPMMDSVFKEFSESYNQANKNWGESASEEVTRLHQLPLRKLFKKLDLYTC